MVHHDVVRNSCPTSVKTFCQSILHSMDCKYMQWCTFIRHRLHVHILQNQVYCFIGYSIWTLEGKFYFKSKFWSLSMPIYKFWIFFYQYMHLSIFKKKPVSGYIYIVCFLAGLVSFSPFPAVADRSIQPLPVIHICQEKRRYAYGLNIFIYFTKI